jgi:hypothetical protein
VRCPKVPWLRTLNTRIWHHRQGRPQVQITPSDLPKSPVGKDPKDLNLLISVFGSQSPTVPGLANQFTWVIRHSLFKHQHCINCISGTLITGPITASRSHCSPLAHHSCALPFTFVIVPWRLISEHYSLIISIQFHACICIYDKIYNTKKKANITHSK